MPADKWTIVSGGAIGVDRTAEQEAISLGIPVISVPAEWGSYGKRAGILRNGAIIELADVVIAFWDRKSPGTRDSIIKAKQAGKPLTIYYPEAELDDVETDTKDMVEGRWP